MPMPKSHSSCYPSSQHRHHNTSQPSTQDCHNRPTSLAKLGPDRNTAGCLRPRALDMTSLIMQPLPTQPLASLPTHPPTLPPALPLCPHQHVLTLPYLPCSRPPAPTYLLGETGPRQEHCGLLAPQCSGYNLAHHAATQPPAAKPAFSPVHPSLAAFAPLNRSSCRLR
jgi:hypothetical protein